MPKKLRIRTTASYVADNWRQMPQSPLQSVLRNIEQLSELQRIMLKCELQTEGEGGEKKEDCELRAAEVSPTEKTSSLASVSAEGVGQDGHGPIAGADVSGDVDGEPVGFERGASVDQGCGESGCE